MAKFFEKDGRTALGDAVAAFEAVTSAELVVSVRPRSDEYLRVNIAVGTIVAAAALTFLLYGEPEFHLHWFIVVPVLLGLSCGAAAGIAPVQRALAPRAAREAAVTRAARASFVEHSVADTRGRTGVLLYVSLAERLAVLVADLGVRERVPAGEWDAAADAIREVVARGGGARELAAKLAALAEVCGRHLPRGEDDVNELPDAVMA